MLPDLVVPTPSLQRPLVNEIRLARLARMSTFNADEHLVEKLWICQVAGANDSCLKNTITGILFNTRPWQVLLLFMFVVDQRHTFNNVENSTGPIMS